MRWLTNGGFKKYTKNTINENETSVPILVIKLAAICKKSSEQVFCLNTVACPVFQIKDLKNYEVCVMCKDST